MRHGRIAAAGIIAAMTLAPAAYAGAPLRLQNFLQQGAAAKPARHSHADHRQRTASTTVTQPDQRLQQLARDAVARPGRPNGTLLAKANPSPVEPKPVPTIAIAGRALTVQPAGQPDGFSVAPERWTGPTAFAPSDEPSLPAGIRIVRADQFNEIDRAADMRPVASARLAMASADESAGAATKAAKPGAFAALRRAGASFSDWLYGKLADGVVTAALAIRSILR